MNSKGVVFIFIGLNVIIMGATLYWLLGNKFSQNENAHDVNKSIYLEGIVVKKQEISSDNCLIKLEVLKASHNEFDVRDSVDVYLLVIKDEFAEIIGRCSLIQIGDGLVYNGKVNRIMIYRNDTLVDIYNPFVSDHMGKFKKIKEWHEL